MRVCQGDFSSSGGPDTRLKSFDGTPLALYVILPPAPASGTDGGYPLVVQSHGYGSKASGPDNKEYLGPTGDAWARDGYAVVQLTAAASVTRAAARPRGWLTRPAAPTDTSASTTTATRSATSST